MLIYILTFIAGAFTAKAIISWQTKRLIKSRQKNAYKSINDELRKTVIALGGSYDKVRSKK